MDDDKDIKPKIGYVKTPFVTEFNVVSSNNLNTINASAVTSKHNYSLPPQAAFHSQPIALIGQPSQIQNKVIVNSTPSHSGNITIATPIQDMQNKMSQNIKLNLTPAMNVMQSAGAATVSSVNQHNYQPQPGQSIQQQSQIQQQQQQQSGQQSKVKIEKTMNMMLDSDRNRILYANLKNNRGGPFLAQLNPKFIVPIQPKNNIGNAVQGIVAPSSILNKNVQRVVALPGNAQNSTISNLRPITGATIGSIVNASVSGGTTSVIIGSSNANAVGTNSGIAINTTNVNNSIINAADNNMLGKVNNQNNADASITNVSSINTHTTNR